MISTTNRCSSRAKCIRQCCQICIDIQEMMGAFRYGVQEDHRQFPLLKKYFMHKNNLTTISSPNSLPTYFLFPLSNPNSFPTHFLFPLCFPSLQPLIYVTDESLSWAFTFGSTVTNLDIQLSVHM